MTLELAVRRQEGVKKAALSEYTSITPCMLTELRLGLCESMGEFGLRLKRAMEPGAKRGFSRQYVHRLETGRDAITAEIQAAFWNIAAALDDVPAGTGGAVLVKVLAQPGQVVEGAFVPRSARVARCANPGCAVQFVRTHPRQRYHDPECRRR